MSVIKLRYHIIESIKLLASEGDIQLACYPEFVCKGDEIANSLGDWLLLYCEKSTYEDDYSFLPSELTQIISLDKCISMLLPDEFSDDAILHSDKWKSIRDKAKETLVMLNEEYSMPDEKSI